jgi:hypothetical protein
MAGRLGLSWRPLRLRDSTAGARSQNRSERGVPAALLLLIISGFQGFDATGVGMVLGSTDHLMALSRRLLWLAADV